jgi:hypothetical protein
MFKLGLIPAFNLFLLRATAYHRLTVLYLPDRREYADLVVCDGFADGAGGELDLAHFFFPR